MDIETKEIRGVNFRTMVWGIATVCTLCASYFSLKSDIKDTQSSNSNSDKINELRLKTLDLRISTLELDLKDLRSMVNQNALKLSDMKK